MKCYVLNKECGKLVDEHHIIKRENGGESGKTVYLSTMIHTALHRSENNLALLEETLSKLNKQQQKRFLYLHKCLNLKIGKKSEKIVNFKLDKKIYSKLQLIANDRGLTVNTLIKNTIIEKLGGV